MRYVHSWRGDVRRLGRDRRAAVALILALAAPVMLLAVAMGLEIGRWTFTQLDLQRTADMAAVAGGEGLANNDTLEQSADAAANVAEINGASGTTNRTWNAGTLVLSDNQVTVKITNGVRNSADPAVLVTVRKPVSLMFTNLLTSATSMTLGSTAMAELGPQPCVLAVGTSGTSISAQGTVGVSLSGCSAYSDSSLTVGGNVTFNASALYASGTISVGSNVTGTATNPAIQTSGVTPLTDPYANDVALQNALAEANCAPQQQPVISGNDVILSPNTCYGNLKIGNTQVLDFSSPGLYTINGSISVDGSSGAQISGSGITIVSTGTLSITGNFNNGAITFTAPTVASAQNGAIPGILFASTSNQATTIGGGTALPYTGLLYLPNANIKFAGTPTGGSTGCAKILAQSVTIVGNSQLSSTCSDYQLTSFGAIPNSQLVQLVE